VRSQPIFDPDVKGRKSLEKSDASESPDFIENIFLFTIKPNIDIIFSDVEDISNNFKRF
jgi:hypothetical protein